MPSVTGTRTRTASPARALWCRGAGGGPPVRVPWPPRGSAQGPVRTLQGLLVLSPQGVEPLRELLLQLHGFSLFHLAEDRPRVSHGAGGMPAPCPARPLTRCAPPAALFLTHLGADTSRSLSLCPRGSSQPLLLLLLLLTPLQQLCSLRALPVPQRCLLLPSSMPWASTGCNANGAETGPAASCSPPHCFGVLSALPPDKILPPTLSVRISANWGGVGRL